MNIRKDLSNKVIIGLNITLIIFFTLNFGVKTATTQSNNCQCNDYQMRNTNDPLGEKKFFSDLTPHGPIEIISDDNFTDYGFNGTGTIGDPYTIENYSIETTNDVGIYICDTTKFFVIRDCFIDAENYGINVWNVADGTASIINNTCTNHNDNGIYLRKSSGATLTNNTCTDNWRDGIYLGESDSATLTNNTCTNNDNGICLDYSSGATLTYNILIENRRYGIYLNSVTNVNNIIHHNNFVDNNYLTPSQAKDIGKNNTWYDVVTKEGNKWSDLGSKCVYKIDGKAHAKDRYPLNRAESCLNPNTRIFLTIVLPVIVSAALLKFLMPKYIIPYSRKHVVPFVRKRSEPIVMSSILIIGIGGFAASLYYFIFWMYIEGGFGSIQAMFYILPLIISGVLILISIWQIIKLTIKFIKR